jgi:hypothetical protein
LATTDYTEKQIETLWRKLDDHSAEINSMKQTQVLHSHRIQKNEEDQHNTCVQLKVVEKEILARFRDVETQLGRMIKDEIGLVREDSERSFAEANTKMEKLIATLDDMAKERIERQGENKYKTFLVDSLKLIVAVTCPVIGAIIAILKFMQP